MVLGVIYQSVVGEDYSFCAPGRLSERIDVTFGVASPLLLGQQTFVIAVTVTAYAFPGRVFLQGTAAPAERFGFLLGYIIRRQFIVSADIQRNIFGVVISPVLIDRSLLISLLRLIFGSNGLEST